MTAPLVDDLTDIESEFAKPCSALLDGSCPHAATWFVWARHGGRHHEAHVYTCDQHKQNSEANWIAALKLASCCSCGHVFQGQLSDNFRAIKLSS